VQAVEHCDQIEVAFSDFLRGSGFEANAILHPVSHCVRIRLIDRRAVKVVADEAAILACGVITSLAKQTVVAFVERGILYVGSRNCIARLAAPPTNEAAVPPQCTISAR
jgi:hypothetical protein